GRGPRARQRVRKTAGDACGQVKRGIAMIRKMLQAVLCIILCPLLVAQQEINPASTPAAAVSSQVTLARDTVTRFIAPNNVPFASILVGTQVRFTVDRDVVLGD